MKQKAKLRLELFGKKNALPEFIDVSKREESNAAYLG